MPTEMIDLLKSLHLMDIILFGIIVGFAFLGFTKGVVKLAIILGSIYVGFLIGAIYYQPVAGLIGGVANLTVSRVAEVVAFLFLIIVVAAVLIVLLYQFFGHMEISGRAGACIDRPLGMLLGFLTGITITSLLVVLIEVPYQNYSQIQSAGGQAPYIVIFNDWYQSSILGPVLKNGLPYLLASISPLLGGHMPPILVKPVGVAMAPLWVALGWLRAG